MIAEIWSIAFESTEPDTHRSCPFLWEDISLCPSNTQHNTFYDALQGYGIRSVKHIYLYGRCNVRFAALRFLNLRGARLQEFTGAESTTLAYNTPTVTLTIVMTSMVNWRVLADLKTVGIGLYNRHKIRYEGQHLWVLYSRLEVLITPFRDMSHVPDDLQRSGFYWIDHQLEFLRRCADLEVLKLVANNGSVVATSFKNLLDWLVLVPGQSYILCSGAHEVSPMNMLPVS